MTALSPLLRLAATTLLALALTAPARTETPQEAPAGIGFFQLAAQARLYDARLPMEEYALQAARENITASQWEFLPQLQLNTGYQNNKQRQTSDSQSEYIQYQIGFSLNLLDFTRDYETKALRAESRAQRHRRDDTLQRIYLETISARMDMHIAGEELAIIGKQLAGIREQLKQVQAREQQGIGARLDVVITEAELATLQNDRENAAARLQSARDALQKLTGRAPSDPPPLRADFTFPPLPDQNTTTQSILANNAELNSANESLSALTAREHGASWIYAPQLAATGNHSELDNDTSSTQFAVQLTVPLFGGGRRARHRAATAQRLSYAESIRNYRLQLRESVRNVYERADAIRRQEKFLLQEIQNRAEILTKTKLAWREGIGTAQQIIDAEQALYAGERNLRELYYQYLNLMTQLRHLNGTLDHAFLHQLDGYFQ